MRNHAFQVSDNDVPGGATVAVGVLRSPESDGPDQCALAETGNKPNWHDCTTGRREGLNPGECQPYAHFKQLFFTVHRTLDVRHDKPTRPFDSQLPKVHAETVGIVAPDDQLGDSKGREG
jgi:hypothetical protein